ncbi:BTAD domain-containing putative transcriptional regulator [Streptomyces sp. cg36]|uniref:AfsR/SARP family transcriptional regulator n=1 Tax=Streptomyces sp. cg36 TaxID=3238798 RepID=UPI0034E2E88B
MLSVRVLGEVGVRLDERDVPLGGPQQRAVLAMLALRAPEVVGVADLVAGVFGAQPPARAVGMVRTYVGQLRKLLDPGRASHAKSEVIVAASGGYRMALSEEALDAAVFARLVESAGEPAASPTDPRVRDALRRALELWHGEPLTGLPGPYAQAQRRRLAEMRAEAAERAAACEVALGQHVRAVPGLTALVAEHPLREGLHELLMLALYRCGRQTDALAAYSSVRRALVDELGVEPGPRLRELHARILDGDPDLLAPAADSPAAPPSPPPAAPVRPRPLLPRRPAGFTGRATELATLDAAVADTGDPSVCAVTGPAGIGKTALVSYWVHRAAERFPDGVLFADLDGFSDAAAPAEPPSVIRDFLLALGTAPDGIPDGPRAAEGLYRSLLHGRRVLVVLDNARSSAQVRPLLPGTTGSATVVTSRNRLSGLVATDCARTLPLERLADQDGVGLLGAVLGRARVGAEPAAAQHLVDLCDGLPLALRLAGARLAGRPGRSLYDAAEELRDERRRLSLLTTDDVDFVSVLRLSLRPLTPHADGLFRQLARHIGPDIDDTAVAALADCDLETGRTSLEHLVAASLVDQRADGRYALHDLVRLFARSLSSSGSPDALPRLLDHYLCGALAAATAAEPGSQPCCELPDDIRRPLVPFAFADRAEAMRWYGEERRNIMAATAAAAVAGHSDRAWRLGVMLWPLVVQQPRAGWEPTLGHALDAACRVGDPDAESRVRTLLGWVLSDGGRHDEALAQLEHAPRLARLAHDLPGEALALVNLAQAHEQLGERERAVAGFTRAAALVRDAGHPQTEMLTLYHVARRHLLVRRPQEALDHARHALTLAPPDQVAARRAMLLDLCGQALRAMGRPVEARDHFERAHRLADREGYTDLAAEYLARAAEEEAREHTRPAQGSRVRAVRTHGV